MKREFMIRSEVYERLSPRMEKAFQLIWDSVHDKRPILIRHHADCDGYSGAVALERAILALMDKVHRRESDIYFYFRRLPSRTPFYDYSDATKDIASILNDFNRHGHKKPLVIVIDNGSSEQDLLSLRKLGVYGISLIVIDHHPHLDIVDSLVDVHINPHLAGGSGDQTAGMLSCEIANMLFSDEKNIPMCALSAVADKAQGPEADAYLRLAGERGLSFERLEEISRALDFETSITGYLENRFQIDDLFFGNPEKQAFIVGMINEELAKKILVQKQSIKKYAQYKEEGGKIIAWLEIDKVTKSGEYPPRGKAVGLLLEEAQQKYAKPCVAMGIGEGFATFRFGKEAKADVNEIISMLQQDAPYAQVSGGGHAKAGSISFVSAARQEVFDRIMEYLANK